MAKSPEDMAASMVANLKEKTGKTLDQWKAIVARSKLAKHGEIVKFLKADHELTHGYANLVAHEFRKGDEKDGPGDPVAAQYAGPKSDLRPIYDALIKAVVKFGKDVEIAPKKSYVSLRRNKQFGLIQPSTRTRVDVGINLPGEGPGPRLEKSGSFNSMVSHRVRVTGTGEVDRELIDWLKEAYRNS